MRTSDPAAYDQLKEIRVVDGKTLISFRAIYLTSNSASAALSSVDITQITNGVAVEKTVSIRTPGNTSFLLPVSGEGINVTTLTNGVLHVLI